MGNEEMVLIGQVSRFDAWRFLVSLDTAMAPAVAKFTSDLFFFPDMVPDGFYFNAGENYYCSYKCKRLHLSLVRKRLRRGIN